MLIKNNFITNYANYTDFSYYVENTFITNFADYADIQYYIKNSFLTDYAIYGDLEYQIYFHDWLRWLCRLHTVHKK